MVIGAVANPLLPDKVRSAFTQLLTHVYIDRFPHAAVRAPDPLQILEVDEQDIRGDFAARERRVVEHSNAPSSGGGGGGSGSSDQVVEMTTQQKKRVLRQVPRMPASRTLRTCRSRIRRSLPRRQGVVQGVGRREEESAFHSIQFSAR